jgi:hypothetical protein
MLSEASASMGEKRGRMLNPCTRIDRFFAIAQNDRLPSAKKTDDP